MDKQSFLSRIGLSDFNRCRDRDLKRHRNRQRRIQIENLEQKSLLAADLTVQLTDTDAVVQPGDSVVYSLDYSNAGDIEAVDVVLRAWVPAYSLFDPAVSSPGWNCDARAFECSLDLNNVAAGASGTANFAVTVDSDLPARVSQISAFARIGANGQSPEPDFRNNFDVERTPIARLLHDLNATLSSDQEHVAPGGSIVYQVDYANDGSASAAGAAVSMRVPAHTTFVANQSSAGWICDSGVCSIQVGNVSPAETGSVTLAVTVNSDISPQVSRITASARVVDDSAGSRDANRANNFDFLATAVDRVLPDLSLVINDGVSDGSPGDVLVYLLSYSNTGTVPATGAVITQSVPDNTVFNAGADSQGWNCTGRVCSLAVGNLAAGASGTAMFPVTVDANIPARVNRISSFARITASGGLDANRIDNADFEVTPLTRSLPDVSVTIDDGDIDVAPGGTIVYSIDYANTGTISASGVVITQPIPARATFNAAGSSSGWNCNAGVCTLSVGDLAAGATGSVQFAVTVDADLASNVRHIFSSVQISDTGTGGNDGNLLNNSSFVRTGVAHPLADIALAIPAITTEYAPGDTVTLTLNYTNTGLVAARRATLNVSLPRNSTFNSASSAAGWNCVDRSCVLNLGDVAAGSSGSTTISFTIGADLNPLIRRLSVIARLSHDGADSDPLDNQGLVGVTVNHGG